jgi:hypothetical protein
VPQKEIDLRTESFAGIATEFCKWIEHPRSYNSKALYELRYHLLRLHLEVLEVPILFSAEETVDSIGQTEWKRVRDQLQGLPFNAYWKIFEPFKDGETPVYCELADDLADIYRDIKEGLILYDQGKMDEAAWEWRFNFEIHWGKHLVGAQYAIHEYLSKRYMDEI